MDEDPVIPRTSIDGIFHTDPPWIRVGEPEPEGEEVLPSDWTCAFGGYEGTRCGP